ncbi:MAG: hypothetical protein A3E87_02810 [Gammaproteobacteria bacterium RIFCSPHIGHO2_12_FULL_35_23]|nr:MAG: hypothetical protein A3E87_02810 [Gammaproteobacteria bacterium RIFCSPHIGHO2_12_FULL_35_23]
MVTQTEFTTFLENLGAFESGINPTKSYGPHDLDWLMVFDPNKGDVERSSIDLTNPEDLSMLQYHVHNTLGFLGKYQFGEPLLIDLGYYSPAPTGYYGSTATNEWQGTWTGKNGVYSKEDFMSSVQELAIREAFAMNMQIIEGRLAQAGKSIDDFLGQEFNFTFQGVPKVGEISISGILASAHLQGPGGVANLLLNGIVSHDEYGTNILSYMGEFGGYQTPFGTAGVDTLVGSDYTETFSGEAGDNAYFTGGGLDKIIITANANGTDVVKDFDINHDVISLANFSGLKFSDLVIINNSEGNAQIDLPNNQKLILEGIASNQVTANLFVQGPIVLGWNYNAGDKVIENFNLVHDVIDFNYAFGLNNLNLYEQNGSTIIDIVDSNQRFILEGIKYADLNAFNFIKAPVGFAEAFFGDTLPPPPVEDNDNSGEEPSVDNNEGGNNEGSDDNGGQVVEGNAGAYSFTWNWGARAVIEDFDVTTDHIDLKSFWTSYEQINFYNNAEGNAVIDLTNLNNQTLTLTGVSLAELSGQNFIGLSGVVSSVLGSNSEPAGNEDNVGNEDEVEVPPPVDQGNTGESHVYSFTWNWNNHQTIQDFDLSQDSIDLKSFWTNYSDFSIHNNAQGNAVIDLTNLNNQTIILVGISAAELSASNISGVTGDYNQALNLSDNIGGNNNQVLNSTTEETEVFSFTWAWGNRDVVSDFEVGHDVVDLRSFWITPDRVEVYNNSQGDAVIDLLAVNNQTITLDGISTEQLNDNSILF